MSGRATMTFQVSPVLICVGHTTYGSGGNLQCHECRAEKAEQELNRLKERTVWVTIEEHQELQERFKNLAEEFQRVSAEAERWKGLADLKDAKGEANRMENNRLRAELAELKALKP